MLAAAGCSQGLMMRDAATGGMAAPRASRTEAAVGGGERAPEASDAAELSAFAQGKSVFGGSERPVAFQPDKPVAGPEALARKVVYTADLKVVVTAVEPALVKARELAEKAGGYVQSQTKNVITIRVPADRFQAVLEQIEGLGSVTDKNVKAEDVTDQFVDLEARLKNARTVEGRLRELLARAKDVKEALEVERELKRLGEEIERIEGRLQYLRKMVALSTVTVALSTKATVPAELEPLIRLPFAWIKELELQRLIQGGPRYRRE
jgi:hypothetical protein